MEHEQRTVDICFAVLHQLLSIRRSVPTSVYKTLVVVLVLSRLHYGNAVLIGLPLPGYLSNRLQSVLNAAARSIAGLRSSDHITDTLVNFRLSDMPSRQRLHSTVIIDVRQLLHVCNCWRPNLRHSWCSVVEQSDQTLPHVTRTKNVSIQTVLSLYFVLVFFLSCMVLAIFTARCYVSALMPRYVIRLSVCLSVTFRYVFHIGWNTSKIISRMISLRFLLGLTQTSSIWSNGNTSNLKWNRGGSYAENLQYLWNGAR